MKIYKKDRLQNKETFNMHKSNYTTMIYGLNINNAIPCKFKKENKKQEDKEHIIKIFHEESPCINTFKYLNKCNEKKIN